MSRQSPGPTPAEVAALAEQMRQNLAEQDQAANERMDREAARRAQEQQQT
jgi:hypothetical protein